MLYLISGAVASGKTTIGRAVADRFDKLTYLEEGSRPVTSTEERLANLELFIADALRLEAEGTDAIFGTQAPLGELLASPRAVELEGIAPCLLDAHDFVRMERWRKRSIERGERAEKVPGMDHFCWAAFHRLHARDPQYEQRVLVDRDYDHSVWRWTAWTADDPRWDVLLCDSTHHDVAATVEVVADWASRIRERGAPLMRSKAWWQ